jgi:c-di-GMP-binding flagellar brake protein YcgR
LERRQHDRIASAGSARIGIGGRPPVPVTTINISSGGLRCGVPPGLRVGEGDSVSVELEHGGERLTVHANVVNSAGTEGGEDREVGLQFMITDEEMAERVSAFVRRVLDQAADSRV